MKRVFHTKERTFQRHRARKNRLDSGHQNHLRGWSRRLTRPVWWDKIPNKQAKARPGRCLYSIPRILDFVLKDRVTEGCR